MIVIDASVLANALTDDAVLGTTARAELEVDPHWAAPEHLVVETFAAIRGRYLGSKIRGQRAVDALETLAQLAIDLLKVQPLLARMWELRDNVSGYDAAYVAAAEANRCPLVTADERLLRADGPRCEVRVAVAAAESARPHLT